VNGYFSEEGVFNVYGLIQDDDGGTSFVSTQVEVNKIVLQMESRDVPINADNDNGSKMTDGIPETRDFNVKNNSLENDLRKMQVIRTGDFGTPISWQLRMTSGGSTRFWDSPTKGREYKVDVTYPDFPPSEIWVEGVEPSVTLKDIVVRIELLYSTSSGGQQKIHYSTPIAITVTPVVLNFTIDTGRVDWLRIPPAQNTVGLTITGALGGKPGVVFTAEVYKSAMLGRSLFIQNLMNVINGGNTAAGFVARTNSDYLDTNVTIRPDQDGPNKQFPYLDRDSGASEPEYKPINVLRDDTIRTISSTDSPGVGLNTPHFNSLQSIEVTDYFTLYLVWYFPTEHGNDPVLYTLAFRPWWVHFWADNSGSQTEGPNRIRDNPGVYTSDFFSVGHDIPVLVPTVANRATEFIVRRRN
jgi:hypothetical protein